MAKFVKLTASEGRTSIYVNMDLVTDFYIYAGQTILRHAYLYNDEPAYIHITETPEEILALIEA